MYNLINQIIGFFSRDMAIDLGTANTLIYVKKCGIVLNEPSTVVMDKGGERVLAVGREAKEMFGKTPKDVKAIRPMKDGVIADFTVTNKMIKHFINKVHDRKTFIRPKMVIGVPTGITQVEKRAVIDSAVESGAREVHLIEEPMAAAIGAGLPIWKPMGNMVVDIGGGTTEVAIISHYSTAYGESLRVAGDEMDEAIVRYMRKNYNLEVGVFQAEHVKMAIGSAFPLPRKLEMEIKGRDLVKGTPASRLVDDSVIREALKEPIQAIIDVTRRALEKVPPEMAADIYDRGVVLAGGGALIKGLDLLLHEETGLKFIIAEDPLKVVVRGAGMVLDNFAEFKKVCIN
jgi:rod shape-determining protein MreB